MLENNSQETRNEGDKLNAIANIISAGGGAIGNIGGLFGKNPTPGTAQQEVIVKSEENKKKTNQLLIYGGGALLLIVILIMFKK